MRKDVKQEAKRWLQQAQEEFKDARILKNNRRYYLALFLCQQSAEKAIKTFLPYKGHPPYLTRSVSKLLESATYFDNNFKQYKNCKRLDDYYIPARCPNALPGDIPSKYFDHEEEVKRL